MISSALDSNFLVFSDAYSVVSTIVLTYMKDTSTGELSLAVPSMVTRVATCLMTSSPITAKTYHVQYQTSRRIWKDQRISNTCNNENIFYISDLLDFRFV